MKNQNAIASLQSFAAKQRKDAIPAIKSAAIAHSQDRPIAKTTDRAVADFMDPDGSLQAAGLLVVEAPPVTNKCVAMEGTKLQIDHGRNRINVFFPAIPCEADREFMKSYRWSFDGQLKCWFNRDTEDNRAFLRRWLNLYSEKKVESTYTPAPRSNYEPATQSLAEIPDDGTEYTRYKKQVTELMEELKVDAADLALLAVNVLHKVTFSKDA